MKLTTMECPYCEGRHQFYLSPGDEQHLRQCPACDRWLVCETDPEDPEDDLDVDALDHPPTCPCDGCDEVLDPEELPAHVVERHDGSLA